MGCGAVHNFINVTKVMILDTIYQILDDTWINIK